MKSYRLIFDGKWKGEFLTHKINNPIKNYVNTVELSVGKIWEMTPNNLCLITITDLPHEEN